MKKILDSVKTFLEMWGRARAAAFLARHGNYRAAQALYVTDHQEQLRAILENPDYDQSMLREWFQQRYGDWWLQAWQRYLETGDISW